MARHSDAEWLKIFEEKEAQAKNNPHKMVRVHAGSYYVFLRGELVEVHTFDDNPSLGWIASEKNNRWYGDPLPTKKAVIASLELERLTVDEK